MTETTKKVVEVGKDDELIRAVYRSQSLTTAWNVAAEHAMELNVPAYCSLARRSPGVAS